MTMDPVQLIETADFGSLTDSSSQVWNLGATVVNQSGDYAVLLDGLQVGWATEIELGSDGDVYVVNKYGDWHEINTAGTLTGLSGDPNTITPDNSTLSYGNGTALVTSSGVWSLSRQTNQYGNHYVLLNGKEVSLGISLQIGADGNLYDQNIFGSYEWNGSQFVASAAAQKLPVGVLAHTATSFLGSLGVNTHLGNWTVYENEGIVQASLAYLGINQIRDGMNPASNAQAEYDQLAAAGIKSDFLVNNGTDLTTFQSLLDAFAKANPGALSAIEGPNEVDNQAWSYNGLSGVQGAVAFQKALYPAVKADPLLAKLPVYNFTIVNTANYTAAGDMAPYADYADVHAYVWDGTSPNGALLDYQNRGQIDAPGLPTVFTETGYDTDTSDPMSGLDPTVQAKYTLDTLMDAFNNGIARSYIYELLDESTNLSDPYSNYGLFYNDGTPKPAATAIHNLTQILADPGSKSFQPGRLNYTLSGLPSDGNSLLMQKSSGVFDLVLWAEPLLWNYTTHTEMAAPTERVVVNFGQAFRSVNVFDPLEGSTPIATSRNAQSTLVSVSDHPIIVALSA